jgi:hypothetical protein
MREMALLPSHAWVKYSGANTEQELHSTGLLEDKSNVGGLTEVAGKLRDD